MNTILKEKDGADALDELKEKQDLLQVIHDDNKAVAELFFQFTQAEEDDEKETIFKQIDQGLTIHAQLVEEVLYPLVKDTAEDDDEEDEVDELVATSEAGAYVAAIILDELNDMDVDEEYFDAKMNILCELTKLQVKREEKEMFDKLRAADVELDEPGAEAVELKASLEEEARNPRIKRATSAKSPAKGGSAKKNSTKPTKASSKSGVKSASGAKSKPAAKSKSATGKSASKKSSGKTNSKKARTTSDVKKRSR